MDQDKTKTTTTANSSKTSKCQRHQEHNYTNPPQDEGAVKSETTNESTTSESGSNHRVRNPSSRIANSSLKAEATRQAIQSSSTISQDKEPLEARHKVIFNRIRRSEEELQKAAEMVRGGMTFQTASDTFNIPISTIRFYMARRGILPQRRRGRGSNGVRDDDLIHPPFEIIHYRLPDIDKPL